MARSASALTALAAATLVLGTFACGSGAAESATRSTQGLDGNECPPDQTDPSACKPRPPTPGPKPGACFPADLASSACLDVGTWERLASTFCGARGASVTGVTLRGSCLDATIQPVPTNPTDPNTNDPTQTGGKPASGQPDPTKPEPTQPPQPVGSATGVAFQCCVNPPPPQPPPNECRDVPLASDQAGLCLDKQRLEELAKVACQGAQVRGVRLDANGCGGVATCCPLPPTQPPTQPPACTTNTSSDGQCSDKQVAYAKAQSVCAAKGMTLGSFDIKPCGQNGDLVIASTFQCCGVPVDDKPGK